MDLWRPFIICLLVSFLFPFLVFPFFIKLVIKEKWGDLLTTHRIHLAFKPSVGGAVVFLGFFLSLSVDIIFFHLTDPFFFLLILTLMLLLGLGDDIVELRPLQKLIGQSLLVSTLLFYDQLTLRLSDFFSSIIIFESWSYFLLTFVVILFIINSYNLIDGLDGLAGSIGIFILACFGGWFFLVEHYALSLLSLCLMGSLVAFLFFNWYPSKILMGDTGTLPVGFFIAYCIIKFVNINNQMDYHTMQFQAPIATAICVFIIPFFDTLRIILIRIKKRQSPFKADKQHIHHYLLHKGYTQPNIVLLLLGINIVFILIAIGLRKQPEFITLPVVILIGLLISFVFQRLYKHDRKNLSVEPRNSSI